MKRAPRLLVSSCVVLLAVLGVPWAEAQVAIAPGSSLTQNFDTIGSNAVATLPSGWRIETLSAARLMGTYTGAVTTTDQRGGANMIQTATSGRYNFGAGNATTAVERAVGFLSSGSANRSGILYLALTNTSATAATNLVVAYQVEKYRNSNNATNYTVQLFTSATGTNWTSAGAGFLSTFTPDGNTNGFAVAPGATVSVSNSLSATLPANGVLYLAWQYTVVAGTSGANAPALGVDEVLVSVIQPVAPDAALSVVLTPDTVAESDTNGVTADVFLSAALTNDVAISLNAAPGTVATLSTNSLVFTAGTTNGSVTVFPVYDPLGFTNRFASVTASGTNLSGGSAVLTVTNVDTLATGVVYVTLASSVVLESDTNGVAGEVVLSALPPTNGVSVTLTAAPGGVVTLSTNVFQFTNGVTNLPFTAVPVVKPLGFTNENVSLSASGLNFPSGGATLLSVSNVDVFVTGTVGLGFAPNPIAENDTNGAVGTVTLSTNAPAGGINVRITGTPTNLAALSTTNVFIAAGDTTGTFTVTPVWFTNSFTNTSYTVVATATNALASFGNVTNVLSITNVDVLITGTMDLSFAVSPVSETDTNTVLATITLSTNAPPAGLNVRVTGSPTNVATVSTTNVFIAAGDTSGTFQVTPLWRTNVYSNLVFTVSLSATNFGVATNKLTVTNVDSFFTPVVVNKYLNSTNAVADTVELLVIGTNAPNSSANLNGMILKDYSSNAGNDAGGRFLFLTNGLWNSVPSGTLIVIVNNTNPVDTSTPWVIRVGLQNTNCFANLSGVFDIAQAEVVQVKAAGSGGPGTTGALHSLSSGTTSGAQLLASPQPKLSVITDTVAGTFAYAINPNGTNGPVSLLDFDGTGVIGGANNNQQGDPLAFGEPNNTNNAQYIVWLRGTNIPPAVNTLSVVLTPSTVAENSTNAVTGVITLSNAAPFGGLAVTVAAAPTGLVTVSTNLVTVPGGTTNASFTILPVWNTNSLADTNVTLTVSASNAVSAFAVLTITNVDTAGTPYGNYMSSFGLTGGDAAPDLDYDGDGLANLLEYAFSQNPASPASRQEPVVGTNGGFLTITVPRNSNASDIVYYVESGSNLLGWSVLTNFTGVDPAPAGTALTITNGPVGALPNEFLRVRVEKP